MYILKNIYPKKTSKTFYVSSSHTYRYIRVNSFESTVKKPQFKCSMIDHRNIKY